MASNSPLRNKTAMEQFRKNLEKRSLNVKFDLENTDYKAIENIGIGAYGVVCSAIHTKTNDKVAIKKIPNVFEALTITKRTYREIKILKHFKHDNIISIREILKPAESYKDFSEIYVVFDLMESDLHKIIYTDQELTEEHIRYFLYQILRGLKYIHSANVIHRDLKPSNLLVNEDCHIRIGDFGMSRGIFYERDEAAYFMTQYVATRWYRAPEILLSLIEYGTAVDMWSVGCIFAEMLGRKHLFPGKDYISQIKLIVGLLGSPSEALLENCQNTIIRDIIKKLGQRTPIPWRTLFPKASKKSLDLLSKMLVINPANRISVDKALEHLFLNKYHDPDDEPICVPPFNFDFEKKNLDKDMLREVIYKEIMEYHQPRTPTFSFNAVLRPAPKPDSTPLMMSQCPPIEKKQLDTQLKDFLQTISFDKPCSDQKTDSGSTQPIQSTEHAQKADEKKNSPVTVDTSSTLTTTQTSDVEMLSAKVSDGKTEDQGRQPLASKKSDKENKPTEVSEQANVTISIGTKARIKHALQAACERRQRTESGGDDGERKPVTAAQRQREREEKRKKKKDRAWEKMKKIKEKKNTPVFILSDADKEMLQRWSQMQQMASGTGSTTVPQAVSNQTIIITSLSQSVLQPVVSNVQPSQQATGTVSSVTGQPTQPPTSLSSVVIRPAVHDSLVHSQSNVLQSQINVLQIHQNVLQTQSNVLQTHSNVLQTQSDVLQTHQHVLQTQSNVPQTHSNVLQTQPDIMQTQPNVMQAQSNVLQTHSNVLQTHSNALQSKSSAGSAQVMSSNNFVCSQQTNTPSLPDQQSHLFQSATNKNDLPFQTPSLQHPHHSYQPEPEQLQQQQQQQHQSNPIFNTVTDSGLGHSEMEQSHDRLYSENSQQLPGHSVSTVSSLGGHTTFSQRGNSSLGVSSTGNINTQDFTSQSSDVFHFSQGYSVSSCQPSAFSQEQQRSQFTQHKGMFSGAGDVTFQSAGSSSLFPTPHHQQHQPFSDLTTSSQHEFQVFQNNPSHLTYNETPANHDGQGSWSTGGDQYIQKSSLSQMKGESEMTPGQQRLTTQDRTSHVTTNRQPRDLKIKCSPPPRAAQVPANHQDLIALLSKQLMKSGMADPFPPALSLTPKGTGGGYGVGTDLDALMVDAQDNIDLNRVEQSPLSSSLIADWLDISGNITQADIEALEREMEMQSPMSLSYSDLNLPNPP